MFLKETESPQKLGIAREEARKDLGKNYVRNRRTNWEWNKKEQRKELMEETGNDNGICIFYGKAFFYILGIIMS